MSKEEVEVFRNHFGIIALYLNQYKEGDLSKVKYNQVFDQIWLLYRVKTQIECFNFHLIRKLFS